MSGFERTRGRDLRGRMHNQLEALLTAVFFILFCASACASAPGDADTALRTGGLPEMEQLGAANEAGEKAEEPAEESADPRKNTLKWTTASEVENFGFDIYRSTSEEGPFDRVTDEPLPGAGTTDEPQSYKWHDFDIEPGVAYFYYIESISMGGVRERFSPIIKAPPKD